MKALLIIAMLIVNDGARPTVEVVEIKNMKTCAMIRDWLVHVSDERMKSIRYPNFHRPTYNYQCVEVQDDQ